MPANWCKHHISQFREEIYYRICKPLLLQWKYRFMFRCCKFMRIHWFDIFLNNVHHTIYGHYIMFDCFAYTQQLMDSEQRKRKWISGNWGINRLRIKFASISITCQCHFNLSYMVYLSLFRPLYLLCWWDASLGLSQGLHIFSSFIWSGGLSMCIICVWITIIHYYYAQRKQICWRQKQYRCICGLLKSIIDTIHSSEIDLATHLR